MDLLRATGGRWATDTYEFVVPIQMHDGKYSIDFFVAGWRYYQGDQVRMDGCDSGITGSVLSSISQQTSSVGFDHAVNVTLLSLQIGKGMRYNDLQLRDLALGSFLHDIGKVFTSDEKQHPEAIIITGVVAGHKFR